MRRIAIGGVAVVGVVAAIATTAPATARPKPPIKDSYTATAPKPGPDNYATQGDVCDNAIPAEGPTAPLHEQTSPLSRHSHEFTAPAAGTLEIKMTDFQADWDLLLEDDKGRNLANSGLTQPVDPAEEKIKFKVKKPGGLVIVACNWAGGPTAEVEYTFTYAK